MRKSEILRGGSLNDIRRELNDFFSSEKIVISYCKLDYTDGTYFMTIFYTTI